MNWPESVGSRTLPAAFGSLRAANAHGRIAGRGMSAGPENPDGGVIPGSR